LTEPSRLPKRNNLHYRPYCNKLVLSEEMGLTEAAVVSQSLWLLLEHSSVMPSRVLLTLRCVHSDRNGI